MKKCALLVIVLALIISLMGCNAQPVSPKTETAFCRVLAVTASGFLADVYDLEEHVKLYENVFIQYMDADKSFDAYDTVVIEYDKADMLQKEDTVPGFEDACIVYEYGYLLQKVVNARLADPLKGEPTFG